MLHIVPVLKRGALDDKNNCILFIARGTNQICQPSERNGKQTWIYSSPALQVKKVCKLQSGIILNILPLPGFRNKLTRV